MNGQTAKYLARPSADGTLDGTFKVALNDNVLSMAMLLNGKLLIGRRFARVDGQPRRHLALLRP